jgi:uncharacterized protein YktA (UPF0223 family)
MLKKTIDYTDYNGTKRSDVFYFNLSKGELLELEFDFGGFEQAVKKIVESEDTKQLFSIFKKIVLSSYGEKSQDGKRFVKSEELSRSFEESEAYSELMMSLVTDANAASDFVNGIVPSNISDAATPTLTDVSNSTTN